MAADKRCSSSTQVLVFAPSKICLHQKEKRARLDAQEPQWNKTFFRFDGSRVINETTIQENQGLQNPSKIDSEAIDSSGIVLQYDPKLVQESINSYLDQEFFASNPQTSDFCESFAFVESGLTEDRLRSFDRVQSEYETVNLESQILLKNSILDGGSSRKRVEGDVLLSEDNTHLLTEEDVYTQIRTRKGVNGNNINIAWTSLVDCHSRAGASVKTAASGSDKSPPLSSQSTCDSVEKKEEIIETLVPAKLNANTLQSNFVHKRPRALPKISDKLTFLSECNKLKDLVNICVIVLQVNPVKEIQIKSGINRGQYISLSSIIVADVSKSLFKITLWRQASCWTDRIVPGDIIIATAIRIETWRNENIGQTTFHSCFYNLHQPIKPLSRDWLQLVSQDRLDQLMTRVRQVYGNLFRTAPPSKREVKFTCISDMQNNTLVHFRGVLRKVDVITDQTTSGTYQFGNQRLPKIRIVFAQSPEEEISVTLWGRQAEWLDDFRKAEGTVWELKYLTAKHDTSCGTALLHTTPKSTKTKLTGENQLAKTLLSSFKEFPCDVQAFKSINDLFETKFSGSAEICGRITAILFYTDTDEVLDIQSSQDVEALNDSCHRLTYMGCGSCLRALNQDKNKIYEQCIHCAFRKPGYNYKIARFYRTFTLSFKDSEGSIEVSVKHSSACKLFKAIQAGHLVQTKKHHNSSKVNEFVKRVKELVTSGEEYRFILSCRTVLDENSFVVSRSFTLLDV